MVNATSRIVRLTFPFMYKPIISEIQIHHLKTSDGLVGFASLVIDGCWFVGNLAIYTRLEGGYRVVYPTKKLRNDQEIPIFHPISKDAGEAIELAVTETINALLH